MSAIYDLYVKRGSDFRQELTVSEPLSTHIISIKESDSHLSIDGTNVSFTIENTDLNNGKFAVLMSSSNTSKLRTGMGSFKIEIKEVNTGITSRLLKGALYVDGGDEI